MEYSLLDKIFEEHIKPLSRNQRVLLPKLIKQGLAVETAQPLTPKSWVSLEGLFGEGLDKQAAQDCISQSRKESDRYFEHTS